MYALSLACETWCTLNIVLGSWKYFYDMIFWYLCSTDNQSVDRAYRIGQTKDVIVYRLMTSATVEEKIYRKQVCDIFLVPRLVILIYMIYMMICMIYNAIGICFSRCTREACLKLQLSIKNKFATSASRSNLNSAVNGSLKCFLTFLLFVSNVFQMMFLSGPSRTF